MGCFNLLLLLMDFCSTITLMYRCFYVYVFYSLTNNVWNCLFISYLLATLSVFLLWLASSSHHLQHSVTDFWLCYFNLFPSFTKKMGIGYFTKFQSNFSKFLMIIYLFIFNYKSFSLFRCTIKRSLKAWSPKGWTIRINVLLGPCRNILRLLFSGFTNKKKTNFYALDEPKKKQVQVLGVFVFSI